MKNLLLIFIGIGLGILLLLGMETLIYTQFIPGKYSIEELGAFGDTVGGLLNPVLTLISISLTFYITLKVAEIANNVAVSQAEQSRKISSFVHAKAELDKFMQQFTQDPGNESKFKEVYHRFFALHFQMEKDSNSVEDYTLASQTLLHYDHDLRTRQVLDLQGRSMQVKENIYRYLYGLEIVLHNPGKTN